MKTLTLGAFSVREDAEKAINRIHGELNVENDEISYVYKNTEGEVEEVDAEDVASQTLAEGAKEGAGVGAVVGGLAGLAAAAGAIPVLGPIVAAGPLVAGLGLTGAVGATAAGAATGAAVGGLTGALINMGVGEERAQEYQDRVMAGDILVTVHSENGDEVERVLVDNNATLVETYEVTVD